MGEGGSQARALLRRPPGKRGRHTSGEVRYFASADSRFFLAAAAMLESLRLSGNTAPAYIVDCGLSPEHREWLAVDAEILDLPSALSDVSPLFAKFTADLFWSSGVVVLLDADMVVTSPLDDLAEQARAGMIAVHPDHDITRARQFPEWARTFELRAPLRPQRYVNCAPLAISIEHWPHFFERWRDACSHLPAGWPNQGFAGPFGLADQDALNALLMSEVPAGSVWTGSDERTVHADGLRDVEIVDARTLACRYRGGSPVVLHYGLEPKPWEPAGWRRIRPDDAYVRLLRRLLFDRDTRIPVQSRNVPLWLRPGGVGYAAALGIGLINFVRVDLRHRGQMLRDRFRRKTV